jgi:hypothetical protein
MNRLEIYAIILAVWGLTVIAAELHGRYEEHKAASEKQLAANAEKITDYGKTLEGRNAADRAAQDQWTAFMAQVAKGIDNVNAKFAGLPSVVVDPRGCAVLTPDAGMRWNAVELVPAGPANDAAGHAAQGVPAPAVPPPR